MIQHRTLMRSADSWDTSLDITPGLIELLVTERRKELLYAQLLTPSVHPRALPFILKGLALWSGQRLCVAYVADDMGGTARQFTSSRPASTCRPSAIGSGMPASTRPTATRSSISR